MLQIFFQSLLIGYSGAIMPGSLLTYTIEKSIRSGAKAGLLVSTGHALLEFVLAILLFLGAGSCLQTPPAQLIVGGLGGAVLIFFGAGMLKDAVKNGLAIDINGGDGGKSGSIIVSGAVISASNPYFLVWWAAVGLGLMMNAYSTLGFAGVAVFYMGHILADFSWYTLVSTLIGKTRRFINIKIYKAVVVVLGIVLICFGLGFIYASGKILFNLS